MAVSRDQFARRVVEYSLMSPEEIAAAEAEARPSQRPWDGQQLARLLVKRKALTAFQAQRIYSGKGKSLVLGNYIVLDKLGQGGMGMVLKAEHRRMKRIVALKVLSPAITQSSALTRRFQREVEAAAKLEHPHIVTAHDADEANGTHFLVMQYVEGTDLAVLVKEQGRLPVEKALACVLQAARGLEYAHRRGVIHRDIKPANLLLDREGTVKILDMGLARLESAGKDQDQLTGTGQIMGTVDYMAPEQAVDTKTADARADIYSLGVTLWYLLTGRPLYAGETAVMRLMAHQRDPIPSLREACPHVSPELEAVFAKMIAKAPESRYQNMTQVIADLERCPEGSAAAPSVAAPPGDNTRFSEFLRGMESLRGPNVARHSVARKKNVASSADEATLTLQGPKVDTDPQLQQSLVGPLPSARTAPAGRMPRPPRWGNWGVLIAGGMAAPLFLWGLLVLFVQTDEGTIRLEINDPAIAVAVKGTEIVLEQADGGKSITLSPGEKTLIVQRGDFQFETDQFLLRDGETVTVRVALLDGTIEVRQGDKLLGQGKLSEPALAAGQALVENEKPPVAAPIDAAMVAGDPDRRAAEWVLSIDGQVWINHEDRAISDAKALPPAGFQLTGISLEKNRQVTDAGLAHFQDCQNLTHLNLFDTQITDAGLAHFQGCKDLSIVCLPETQVTDAGLAYLQDCENLSILWLQSTKITDAGLDRLGGLTKLRELLLHHTPVTAQGLAELHKKLPRCAIYWDGDTIEPEKLAASAPTTDPMDAAMAADSPDRRAAEWALSIGGTVWVNHEDREITDAKTLPPVGFQLTGVSLKKNQQVTDAGLGRFEDCTNLTHLNLGGTNISDAGLAYFRSCDSLTELDLQKTKISDAGLAHLRDCAILASLRLGDTQVGDAGLAHLRDCNKLTTLHLNGTGVTDAGLVHFHDCKNLSNLWLNSTIVTDEGLAHFQDCNNLTYLNLGDTQVTDAGLAHLRDCKKLAILCLPETKTTDTGLTHLQDCKNLSILWLQNTQITDAGLDRLVGLTKLRELQVQETQVTDQAVSNLHNKLPQCTIYWDGGVIEPEKLPAPPVAAPIDAAMTADDPDRRAAEWALSIGGTVRINHEDREITDVKTVPRESFQLTGVFLDKNQQVTDAGLAHFQGCKNLTTLSVAGTQVTNAGLACFQGCKDLTKLDLDYCAKISDAGLAHFQDCKDLTYLSLIDTQITDAGLAHFRGCNNLTSLYVSGTHLTDAGLVDFQDCKKLRVLCLNGTKISDQGLARFQDCKDLTYLNLGHMQIGDAGLAHFQDCENLRVLYLINTKTTDAGLAYFQDCQQLTLLWLHNTKITDAGLAHFQDCKVLRDLALAGTQISDAGLAHFQGCKNMSSLNLNRTQTSDAGLAYVAGMMNLGHLHLKETQVTAQAVADLHKKLPQCTIYWDGDTFEPE